MADPCDHARAGSDDVGRIQPAAKSGLQDDDIHPLADEPAQRDVDIDVEHGQLQRAPFLIIMVDQIEEFLFPDPPIVDADAVQMRDERGRSQCAHAQSGRVEHAADIVERRALAVRPGDMDDLQRADFWTARKDEALKRRQIFSDPPAALDGRDGVLDIRVAHSLTLQSISSRPSSRRKAFVREKGREPKKP